MSATKAQVAIAVVGSVASCILGVKIGERRRQQCPGPGSALVQVGLGPPGREDAATAPSSAAVATRAHPAVQYGIPCLCELRYFDGFVVGYDRRLRQPLWVAERLSRSAAGTVSDGVSLSDPVESRSSSRAQFHEDAAISEKFRSTLAHYRRSGYDRGHMACASNHKRSRSAYQQTFTLSNVSPQWGRGFNRDYWARLERLVQLLALSNSTDVHVVTGPLWLAKETPVAADEEVPYNKSGWSVTYPVIGGKFGVAVPTHFFKSVLVKVRDISGSTTYRAAAWVLPNTPISETTPLSEFAVSLEQLERMSGLELFPLVHGAQIDAQQRRDRDAGSSAAVLDDLPPPNWWEMAQQARTSQLPKVDGPASKL